MKKAFLYISAFLLVFMAACEVYESPDRRKEPYVPNELYSEQYDPVSDNGQYWMPEFNAVPKRYVTCAYVAYQDGNNDLGATDPNLGLQAHLLAQSTAGIINRALKNGTSEYGVWFRDEKNNPPMRLAKQYLDSQGAEDWSVCVPSQVASAYGELRQHIDGYVLTDIENNPESAIVASVAAHVYNAVIVDVRDEASYTALFPKLYDATAKTTADSWREFKDKCNNKGLVVMPVQTGQLREFSITNEFFVVNLNKEYANPAAGQNIELFEEVLAWLAPNAPVFGWEQGVTEDAFVARVTRYGHMMVPYDWAYNTSLMSLNYKERQTSALAHVTNPQFIDFDSPEKKYVSFYLSDGDNVQWMLNNFDNEEYYLHPQREETKITFGLPIANLPMMAPSQFENIIGKQLRANSVMENLGGGYYYVDLFAERGRRSSSLKKMAADMASHMRQHRVKILGLVAMDPLNGKSQEAYEEFISANDQLEGIVVIQYAPYAGGKGEIMWFTNSKGIDIPVVCVKYSIWNFGDRNNEREGSPTYIAHKVNDEGPDSPFSMVSIHAWSRFHDIGDSEDEIAESQPGGNVVGAGAAALCMAKLADDVAVVNTEELIWRIRMHYRPEQTKEILSKVF